MLAVKECALNNDSGPANGVKRTADVDHSASQRATKTAKYDDRYNDDDDDDEADVPLPVISVVHSTEEFYDQHHGEVFTGQLFE